MGREADYRKVIGTISKLPADRSHMELLHLEDWFRKKSKLMKELRRGEPGVHAAGYCTQLRH